jgi:hypothetical protein
LPAQIGFGEMAAINERNVWVQLRRVGEDGKSKDVGTPTKIKIAASADVDDLRDAVSAKFAPDLVGITAARLNVSRSTEPKDEGARLKSYDDAPTDTTGPKPIYVHAPAAPASTGAARFPPSPECTPLSSPPLSRTGSAARAPGNDNAECG